MMMAAAGLIFLTTLGQSTQTFQDKETGLTFSYPSNWEYRKERLYSVFEIPLEGGRKANVQVLNVAFRQEQAAWQTAQADVAKTMNRTVERQWDEVILGVPLLLTQLSFKEGDTSMSSLVGLLYSRSGSKLSFRLTSTAEGYTQAEGLWRSALNTLRTISGDLPTVEDPTKPPSGSPIRQPNEPKVTSIPAPKVQAPKLPRGVKQEPMEVLGQKLQITLPRSWSVVKKESSYVLTREGWDGEVVLDFGAGGILEMRKAVINLSNSKGASFGSIAFRSEEGPDLNAAGANVFQIERRGKLKGEGETLGPDEMHLTTGGHAGLYYWVTFLNSQPGKTQRKATDHLKELHKVLNLAPQP